MIQKLVNKLKDRSQSQYANHLYYYYYLLSIYIPNPTSILIYNNTTGKLLFLTCKMMP